MTKTSTTTDKKQSTTTKKQSAATKNVAKESKTVVAKNVEKPETVAAKTKKVAAVKAEVQVVAEPVVHTEEDFVELSEENNVIDPIDVILTQFSGFMATLQKLSASVSAIKTEFRAIEKKCARELKIAQKVQLKKKKKSGNRAPSGFAKPTKISDELATFLNKPTGFEMSRTDAAREINAYIRENKLQNSKNGRYINADPKMIVLLKLSKTDELTYFNLQRFMSPHFAKIGKPVGSAEVSVSV